MLSISRAFWKIVPIDLLYVGFIFSVCKIRHYLQSNIKQRAIKWGVPVMLSLNTSFSSLQKFHFLFFSHFVITPLNSVIFSWAFTKYSPPLLRKKSERDGKEDTRREILISNSVQAVNIMWSNIMKWYITIKWWWSTIIKYQNHTERRCKLSVEVS